MKNNNATPKIDAIHKHMKYLLMVIRLRVKQQKELPLTQRYLF